MNLSEDPENLPYIGTWEIYDPRLEALVNEVLSRIPDDYEDVFPTFNVLEGTSPWSAHVEPDGDVILDAAILLAVPCEVAIGTIAHELTHIFLRHSGIGGLDDEYAADDLAVKWGLESEVSAMRRACGPPTLE